jgi:nitroreductase
MRTIKEALMWRAAIKEYNKEALLSDEEVSMLMDAVRMAPSSYGLQPYKLIVVKSTEMRERLKAVSYNQSQVTDASHFVVFASKVNENENDVAEFVQRIIAVRGVTEESLSGYAGMMNGALGHMNDDAKRAWAGKQAYLGLGVLLTAAALAEIDASPMEGFDAGAYDEILDLKKDGYTTAVICALGRRVEGEKYAQMPKVRKSQEEFVVFL